MTYGRKAEEDIKKKEEVSERGSGKNRERRSIKNETKEERKKKGLRMVYKTGRQRRVVIPVDVW